MNRSTADAASDTGKEEGIESRKLWWKRLANQIIQDDFGQADLEWGWCEDVEIDPLKQAQIDEINLKNGTTFINEVRDARGLEGVEGGDQPLIYLPTGVQVLSHAVQASLTPSLSPPALAGGGDRGAVRGA
jgi:hypothetical protein